MKSLGGLKGKLGNTRKFLSSGSASKSLMGMLPGSLRQTLSGVQSQAQGLAGKFQGTMGMLPGSLGQTFGAVQGATAVASPAPIGQQPVTALPPGMPQPSAAMAEYGAPQAFVVPPPGMPQPSAPQAFVVPPPPPPPTGFTPVPSSNIPANIKQKYPTIRYFYLAKDGKYYPVNNLAKFGPKMNTNTKNNSQKGGTRRRRHN